MTQLIGVQLFNKARPNVVLFIFVFSERKGNIVCHLQSDEQT